MAEVTERKAFPELERFAMFEPVPDTHLRSKLSWSVARGCPRITVFPNTTKEERSIINAPMNPETFYILLKNLEIIAKGEPGAKFCIKNDTISTTTDGKKERVYLSETWVGKDKDGLVWISVISGEKPKVKFTFRISDFHHFIKSDGSAVTEAESSVYQALAVAEGLRLTTAKHIGILRADDRRADAAKSATKPAPTGSATGIPSKPDEDLFV